MNNKNVYNQIMERLSIIVKKNVEKNNVLNEGQFSWFTQDTGEQIGCEENNQIHVVMSDLEGNQYPEDNYEGYGVFGGKDFYVLLAEMNGFGEYTDDEDTLRDIGISLEYSEKFLIPGTTDQYIVSNGKTFTNLETGETKRIFYPALTTDGDGLKYTQRGEKPETDPNQGWSMEDDEDDYYEDEY